MPRQLDLSVAQIISAASGSLDGLNLNDALLRYYQGVEKRLLRTSTIAGEVLLS
jgi:hypothetical protein